MVDEDQCFLASFEACIRFLNLSFCYCFKTAFAYFPRLNSPTPFKPCFLGSGKRQRLILKTNTVD